MAYYGPGYPITDNITTTTTTTYYYAAPPPPVTSTLTTTTDYYNGTHGYGVAPPPSSVPLPSSSSHSLPPPSSYYPPSTSSHSSYLAPSGTMGGPNYYSSSTKDQNSNFHSEFSGLPPSSQFNSSSLPSAASEFSGLPPSSTFYEATNHSEFSGLPPSSQFNSSSLPSASEFSGLPPSSSFSSQDYSGLPPSHASLSNGYSEESLYQSLPPHLSHPFSSSSPSPTPSYPSAHYIPPPQPSAAFTNAPVVAEVKQQQQQQGEATSIPSSNQMLAQATGYSIAEEPLEVGKERRYSEGEMKGMIYAVVGIINEKMKGDSHFAKFLPVNPNSQDLFNYTGDGLLFNKLINIMEPETVDERTLNQGENLNIRQREENVHLALNSARGLGCDVSHLRAREILNGNKNHSISLLWTILKMGNLNSIHVSRHPALFKLLQEGETMDSLFQLSPYEILVRWVNYQLQMAQIGKRISNLDRDIADSEAYIYLLNHIAPLHIRDLSALGLSDHSARASNVLLNANKIGCGQYILANDIVSANQELNTYFVSQLFHYSPNLGVPTTAPLPSTSSNSSPDREVKAFQKWINSLGIPIGTFTKKTLADGSVLLKIIDQLKPGTVNWSKVQLGNNNALKSAKFQQIENCNYALELCKSMGLSSVNISGADIQAENEKLGLALIWQLMRYHLLHFTKNSSFTEEHIIAWVNQKVSSTGRTISIRDFNDKSLCTSHFILDLLTACRPGSVDYTQISLGKTTEQQLKNAKYAISCARKLGCPSIFLLPEDIVEVNGKLVMTLFASIMQVYGPRS